MRENNSETATAGMNRRRFIRFVGAVGVAGALPASASAEDGTVETVIDDALDTTTDALQEVLVVFEDTDDIGLLEEFDLPDGYTGSMHCRSRSPGCRGIC